MARTINSGMKEKKKKKGENKRKQGSRENQGMCAYEDIHLSRKKQICLSLWLNCYIECPFHLLYRGWGLITTGII